MMLITASLVLLMVILPLWRTPLWWVRIWDFPKIQILVALFIHIALFISTLPLDGIDLIFLILLSIACLHILKGIYPYSPLANREVPDVSNQDEKADIKLFIANVLQENTQYDRLIDTAQRMQPDVIMLCETDLTWQKKVAPIFMTDYPYCVEVPLERCNGLLLYSKLPLRNTQIRYLTEPYIPSITTDIALDDNREIRLYGIHPRPPRPQNDADERNCELWTLAKECRELSPDTPIIIAGDMNDVGWSRSTRRFLDLSGMLDPRKGRGLFNSYHAKHTLMRWPLDHIFLSRHFAIATLKRLPYTGSDHFPIYTELSLK